MQVLKRHLSSFDQVEELRFPYYIYYHYPSFNFFFHFFFLLWMSSPYFLLTTPKSILNIISGILEDNLFYYFLNPFKFYILVFRQWLSGKESACNAGDHLQCRRLMFDSWVGKILWRRKWQPNPVFLAGESHGQRSLAGSPWGYKKNQTQLSN